MKASQKLKICFDGFTTIQRFEDLDKKLLPLAAKLEKEGDIFGPVHSVPDGNICVTMEYADKKRDAVKPTIFGYDSDEFIAKSIANGSASVSNALIYPRSQTNRSKKMATISIVGYEQEGHCEHCGRPLKHCIRLSDGRIVGATCLDKKLTKPKIYMGKKYRLGSSEIIRIARMVERYSPATLAKYGIYAASTTFVAA